MASPIDLTALMNDPEKLKLIQEQAMSTTPMQPQVQGIGMPELPTKEKDIQRLIRQKFLESQLQQQQAVEESKRLLAEEMQKNQELGVLGRLDLRPFAAAARQYGATTAVVPTEAPTDNKELMAKLRSEIQKSQQGMSNEQIGFLKTMMEDKRAAQADISLRNAEARETKAVVDPLIKIIAKGSDFKQDLGQIESVVNKKEIPIQEFRQIVTKVGKALGEAGAQTEGDRASYYDPTVEDRVNQYLNKIGFSGKISVNDPSVQAIIAQLKYSRQQASEGIARKADSIAETYGSPGSVYEYLFRPGKPGQAAVRKAKQLSQDMLMPKQAGAASKSKAPTKDINSMTKEELKDYLGE